MPQTVANISSINWQISTAGFGIVAEGLEDIRQCLDIILRTPKGQDSFRPEFGSDIFQYVDAPVNVAVPNIKRCIIDAVATWEKRVKLINIDHKTEVEHVTFFITYQLVDEDIIDSLQLSTGINYSVFTSQQTALILQGFYPPNLASRPYNIILTLNGQQAIPFPPTHGFTSLNALFAWLQDNYSYAGRWEMLIDRFVLYARGAYTSGSVSVVLVTGTNSFKGIFPILEDEQVYRVDFSYQKKGEVLGVAVNASGYSTKDGLLQYMRDNYGDLGEWSIVTGSFNVVGDFSFSDFDGGDFYTGLQGYYLQIETELLESATITITAV